MQNTQGKPTAPEIVVSCLFGLAFAIEANYSADTSFQFSLLFVLQAIILSVLFCVAFTGGRLILGRLSKGAPQAAGSSLPLLRRAARLSTRRLALALALALFIAWLPYLIALYPGNLSNDTTGQLVSFISFIDDEGPSLITTHHPVLDTLIFGFVVYPFYAIGRFQIGVFVCIVLQMACTAASFATVFVIAARRWKVPTPLVGALFAIVLLCPLVPILVCGLSKDTFFSWTYLPWLALVFDTLASKTPLIAKKRWFVVFLILCALAVLTKKLGVYVVLATLICMALALRKEALLARIGAGLACVILANWAIAPLLAHATSAQVGTRLEMFAVPVQQTALSMTRYPDEYGERDRMIANVMLDVSKLEGYDPRNTDSIKQWWAVWPDDGSISMRDWISLYVRMGLAHPADYADAWLTLESPLFAPSAIVPLFDSAWHTQNDDYLPESCFEKPLFSEQGSAQVRDWYNWLTGLPIVGILFMQPFYALALPGFLLCGLLNSRRRMGRRILVAFVPILISIAGLFVSPTVIAYPETMRYMLPFVYTAPLIIMFYTARLLGKR